MGGSAAGKGDGTSGGGDRSEALGGGGGVLQTFIILVCVSIYWNSLQCGFVFDDMSAIRDNRDLRPHVPLQNLFRNDFWGTPMNKEQSHKSYRPVTVITFRLNYLMHELEPLGYHLVNILLHAGVTLTYHSLCCSLLSRPAAGVAALLFAVHPVHTEAVTGVVGRAELLASLFFLSALLRYKELAASGRGSVRLEWKGLMWISVLVALSMLCKEQGITVLGLCVLHEMFVEQGITVL